MAQLGINFEIRRDKAIEYYRRVKNWAERQEEILRATILIPEFGGCGCRMHNCKVNFETGRLETTYEEHERLAKLAKLYDYRQKKIWDVSNRLGNHFAKFF